MYSEDWIMRQIKMFTQMISRLLLKKDIVKYEIKDELNFTQTDLLYKEVLDLMADNKINKAEELIFDNLKTLDFNVLTIAIEFYDTLNTFSEKKLDELNFSREEIQLGLNDIAEIFGVELNF